MGQSFCSTCTNEENLEKEFPKEKVIEGSDSMKVKAGVSHMYPSINNNNKRVEIIEYDDGSVYTGEVLNSRKSGFGVLQNNKQFYEGEFENDVFCGFGYVESVKKIAYMGQFSNNFKSGIGVQFSLTDAYVYEGEWRDNHKNGLGREILPDNSEYIGEFVGGKKHGRGIYKMANGRRYEGEFKGSKIDGHGYLVCDNGDYYNGFWEDNEYNGFGILCKKESLFKGFFKKDKKHGYGIKYSSKNPKDSGNTIILVGNWIENSLEGLALGINPANYKVEKIYKFTANKLKSSTSEPETIKEKTVSNRDCTNLLNFYIEYKDKE